MSTFLDRLDRLVFGATAQERVDMLAELAARRVEQRIAAAFTDDGSEDDTEQEREPITETSEKNSEG